MKKTRKVLSIVTVVVLVLYFSSMAVLYGNMKDTVKANIYDEASTSAEEFNNNSYEDLENFVKQLPRVVILDNIMDKTELENKLRTEFEK